MAALQFFMKVPFILLFLAFSLPISARDFRDLTNTERATINAEILDLEGENLRIRSNGTVFEVPVNSLSEADQKWITEWNAKRRGAEDELYYSEVIFEDDFSSEGFGERWGHYKSESVVEDGIMIGKTIDINDHAGCDSVRFEGRQDMEVSVKFKFASEEAKRFNVWFDDKGYDGSHAGHITSVFIDRNGGSITDAKTGNMANDIYEKKKSAAGLDDETKELLASKTMRFDADIENEEWHDLVVRTKGAVVTVLIDGDEVAEFESEGNAHDTKSLISLTTNVNDVHYDDFVVKAAPAAAE